VAEVPSHQRFGVPSGVARTAMYMSLIRDHESRRPDALFRDPFSAAVVAELAGSQELDELAVGLGGTLESLSDALDKPEFRYFPVRTRYFDDRLVAAMHGGIRQVVSLAAGADGRPMRLDCPAGTRWYELDMPEMVAFKKALMARTEFAPTCNWYGIGADLAADWYGKLQQAGFDQRQPSVWLVEGLLMYVADEVAHRILAKLTGASAPSSQLLVEHLNTKMMIRRGGTIQDAVKAQNVVLVSARDDIAEWLAGYGWRAVVHAGSDPAIGYGRLVPEMPAGWLACATLQVPNAHKRLTCGRSCGNEGRTSRGRAAADW
jgi:methyltransferase (TIGR00027 family)